MRQNTTQLVIGADGYEIAKINAFISNINEFYNVIQVISPFPITDSVSVNYGLRSSEQDNLTQYLLPLMNGSEYLYGKDVLTDNTAPYYQTVKNWYVWQAPISSTALRAISKYHSGEVSVAVTFREFKTLLPAGATTERGSFGLYTSSTGGDLPTTANAGDYYRCEHYSYYSVEAQKTFTYGDLAFWTDLEPAGWVLSESYEFRIGSSSTSIGIEASILGQAIEDVDSSITEQILERLSIVEASRYTGIEDGNGLGNFYGWYPDETNLLIAYPNDIAEPNDRTGWFVALLNTDTLWDWSRTTNQWEESLHSDFIGLKFDAVEDRVTQTESDISTNDGLISGIDTRLTTAEGNITSLEDEVDIIQDDVIANEGSITALDTRLSTAEDDITDINAKTTFITITQPVDLDTMESQISTNESNISTNETDITNIELKTDLISVTQAVDLDSMESQINTNIGNINTKVSKTGDTMTGDLVLDKDGTTEVGSHGIVFSANAVSTNYSKELNMNKQGQLLFDGNPVGEIDYVSDVTWTQGTNTLSFTGVGNATAGDVVISGFVKDTGDTITGNLTIDGITYLNSSLNIDGISSILQAVEIGGEANSHPLRFYHTTGDSDYYKALYVSNTGVLIYDGSKVLDASDSLDADSLGGSAAADYARTDIAETFESDVTIQGNLTVEGTSITVDSTNVQIADRVLELAKDNATALTGFAGIAVRNYDGTNDGGMIIDNAGEFRVGDVTIETDGSVTDVSSVPLLARDEKTNLADNDIFTWDNSTNTAKGYSITELDLATESDLQLAEGRITTNEGAISSLSSNKLNNTGDSMDGILTMNETIIMSYDSDIGGEADSQSIRFNHKEGGVPSTKDLKVTPTGILTFDGSIIGENDIDYVSSVAWNDATNKIEFTGVGNAYNNDITITGFVNDTGDTMTGDLTLQSRLNMDYDTNIGGEANSKAIRFFHTTGTSNYWKPLYVDNGGQLVYNSEAVHTDADFDSSFVDQDVSINSTPEFNGIVLDPDASEPTYEEGMLYWDSIKRQPTAMLSNSNVRLNLGFEMFVPIENTTGSILENGTVVYPTGYYVDGNGTGWFTVGKANARDKHRISPIAVITSELAVDGFGYAAKFGLVQDVDTSGMTVGDRLYVSNDDTGNFTNIRPLDGSYPTTVGFVVKVGTTDGIIQIDITESELTVDVTNQNGFPRSERFKTTLSIIDVSRTFTITPSEQYHFYDDGVKYEKNAVQSIVFTDTEGIKVFYFDDGVLSVNNAPTPADFQDIVLNKTFVALTYWDATANRTEYILDERHGLMDPETHLRLHQGEGTIYLGGMTLTVADIDNNSPTITSIQYSLTEGYNKDEDIEHTIPQKLVASTIREYAFSGTTGDLRRQSENAYGLSLGANGRPNYNLFNGSTWSISEIPSGNYFWRHIYAIPETDKTRTGYRVHMGTSYYASKAAAELGIGAEHALIKAKIDAPEYTHAYAILYEAKDNYTNGYKARIVSTTLGGQALDYRTSGSKGSSSTSASDHSALSGRDAIGSHPATAISYAPSGNISAINVQTAISELDGEKLAKAGGTITGGLVVNGTTTLNSTTTFDGITNLLQAVEIGGEANSQPLRFYHTTADVDYYKPLYVNNGGQLIYNTDVIYHAGNLTKTVIDNLNVDADTLDGLHASSFLTPADLTTHASLTGVGTHIPSGGTVGKFLAYNGTWLTPSYASSITHLSEPLQNNKVWYTNNVGTWIAISLGASGTVLKSTGVTTAPSFQTEVDTNDYVDAVSFDISSETLTIGRTGVLSDLTTSLAGYLKDTEKAADSDKLDGIDSSSFLRSNQVDTMSEQLTMQAEIVMDKETPIGGEARSESIAFRHQTIDTDYLKRLDVDNTGRLQFDGNTVFDTDNLTTAAINALNINASTLDTHDSTYFQPASTAINTSNISSQSVSYAADAGTLDTHDSTYFQPASTAITTANIGSQSVSYASNAGTLDGVDSSNFLRSNTSDFMTGQLTMQAVLLMDGDTPIGGEANSKPIRFEYKTGDADLTKELLVNNGGQLKFNNNTVYDSSNLTTSVINALNVDADTLDGHDTSYFATASGLSTHTSGTGIGSHIPTGGSSGQYLNYLGTWTTLPSDVNYYVDALSFSSGTLTLGRTSPLGDLTVSLDGRYLPLSGGTITGTLNLDKVALTLNQNTSGTTPRAIIQGIGYDVNGDGVLFGNSGGALVLSAGESWSQMSGNVGHTAEDVTIGADTGFNVYTGLQSGWASRQSMSFSNAGILSAPTISEGGTSLVSKYLGINATASSATTLTGLTSTVTELNKLDGYTGSATELNWMDTLHATGVTSTEFDYLDGVTSNIQSQLDTKQLASTAITTSNIGSQSVNYAATSGSTGSLTGLTSTVTELNKLDGYTGSATELNYAKSLYDSGVTATEYDYLDGVTSSIQTQLNGKLATGGTAANSQLLDSLDSTAFLRSNANDIMSGILTMNNEITMNKETPIGGEARSEAISFIHQTSEIDYTKKLDVDNAGQLVYNTYKVWHAGNDGSGTGLDADLLDGLHASSFMRATTDGSYYGLTDPTGGSSNWIRTTTNGFIPSVSGGSGSIGTSSWNFNNIYGVNIYDSNTLLEDKYLGINATASAATTLTSLTSTVAELNKLDGYTGSATELNYAKSLYDTGVTSTEFDYLDGVTSAIQTQLNGKDNYNGWNLLVNSLSTNIITSGENVNFVEGAGIDIIVTSSTTANVTVSQKYASSTTIGGMKARISGTTLYLRNDGSNA